MNKFAKVFLILGVSLIAATSRGSMHTDVEIAEMDKEADDIQRTLDGFSKNLTGGLLAKYESLRSAMEVYASAHGDNEANAPGTGWADSVAADKNFVRKEFIDLIRKFESKNLKVQSQSNFKRQDAELNRVYNSLLKNKGLDSIRDAALVTRKGLRETQRDWVTYRDAWLEFTKVKFPNVSPGTLKATLTADRISLLKRIEQRVNHF